MKIRVNNTGRLGGGEVLVPVDPVPPVDLDDLFTVGRFEVTETEAPPFSELTVEWTIEVTDPATQVEDFEFRLIGPPDPAIIEDGIPVDGEHTFTLLRSVQLRLQGRRIGGSWTSLGPQLSVSVDESDCRRISYPGSFVDTFVFEGLREFTADTAELRLRSVSVPVDPNNPQGPRERVQLEPTSEWTAGRIHYDFPLEIVTPNFFNADLDLQADVTFAVTHDDDGTDVDVRIAFEVDVDYSGLEDVVSLGSTAAVAKTVEALLPLVLECRRPEIEAQFAYGLFKNSLVEDALADGRLFDVDVRPRSRDTPFDILEIVVCEVPMEPREPSDGPDTRGATRRGT